MIHLNKAVFIDKDGTLIWDRPYNVDSSRIEFFPGALRAASRLSRAGFRLIVVTNQPGVALGKFSVEALHEIEAHLVRSFREAGAELSGFYFCPHHSDGVVDEYRFQCHCRKPEPGLIHQAVLDHGLDLSRSWMVGDILNDVEAGNRAGCRSILIHNGNETEWEFSPVRVADFFARDFVEATEFILEGEKNELEKFGTDSMREVGCPG